MSRDKHQLVDYFTHILQAIERIERYTAGIEQATFLANEMIQDAVIRNLEIIGEASHNIEGRYPEFAAAHPDLPLASASQMRNVVSHGYFKVDLRIVWKTIESELPRLREKVQRTLESLPAEISVQGKGQG